MISLLKKYYILQQQFKSIIKIHHYVLILKFLYNFGMVINYYTKTLD